MVLELHRTTLSECSRHTVCVMYAHGLRLSAKMYLHQLEASCLGLLSLYVSAYCMHLQSKGYGLVGGICVAFTSGCGCISGFDNKPGQFLFVSILCGPADVAQNRKSFAVLYIRT